MLNKGRTTIIRELGCTEDFRVYLARDIDCPTYPTGVTVFLKYTPDVPEPTLLTLRASLRLARLSDFGSRSRMRLHPRVLTANAGEGYYAGMYYQVWILWPRVLTNPYPDAQRRRKSEFSRTVRRTLVQAADGKCQICGGTEGLQLDHLVPIAFGGTGDLSNGMVLCEFCHRAKTAMQFRCKFSSEPADQVPDPQPRYYELGGEKMLGSHAPVYLSKAEPYYLKLHGSEIHYFPTQHDLWLWITTHAKELLQKLP